MSAIHLHVASPLPGTDTVSRIVRARDGLTLAEHAHGVVLLYDGRRCLYPWAALARVDYGAAP